MEGIIGFHGDIYLIVLKKKLVGAIPIVSLAKKEVFITTLHLVPQLHSLFGIVMAHL